MQTLWLASWYPNRVDPFNGDFVQRHALALAGRVPVTVIHVAKVGGAAHAGAAGPGVTALGAVDAEGPFETVTRRGLLTERISYFRSPATGRALWDKLVSQVRAFRAYRRAFRSYVLENGRPDLVHVHVCMNAGLFALYLRWTRRIPFVVTEHFSAYVKGSPEDFYTRPFLYRFLNRLILERAVAVHSVSQFLLTHIEKIARLKQTAVIPNAVDTALFRRGDAAGGAGRVRPAGDAAGRNFRFIHISNFAPLKNVPGILDAFTLLATRRKDWELVLVGPSDEAIRAYGAARGLAAHLRWVGEVPYATVADELRASGALVHFSWIENQPCVIAEAFCCGVPVVAAAVGGIPEVLEPAAPPRVAPEGAAAGPAADRGLLVPSRDVEALAEALQTLMERTYDREAIAAISAAIYSYDAVGAALEAFYAAALGVLPEAAALNGAASDALSRNVKTNHSKTK